MRWLSLFLWGTLAVYGGRNPRRRLVARLTLSAALVVSMACQLFLLYRDGLLSLATGLPLHLCGAMGVASLPMIWRPLPRLYHFSLLLGAPCAFLALLFPAMVNCSQPWLMALAFNRLHCLIVACALFCGAQKQPPPGSAVPSFLLGNGYLIGVAVFNHLLNTNYLFLRAAPSGTPLALLFSQGPVGYLCALELSCMLLMRLMLSIAGNRSAYNRCSCRTAPGTTPRRG